MNQLFDKQVKLYLYTTVGGKGEPSEVITIPETGIKPSININADFKPGGVIMNPAIRIHNFYPSKQLSDYKLFKVLAGYRDSTEWSGFEGKIWVAYQESPSPDGVTLFSCETANTTDIYNSIISIHATKGASVDSVLSSVVDSLSKTNGNTWTKENSVSSYNLKSQLDYNGTVKDFMAKLKEMFGFIYMFSGHTLISYNPSKGRTDVDKIDIIYLSSPPSQAAEGITFTSPWIPSLQPGMKIHIDPKYFKQTFTGGQVETSTDLICQTVSLQFNTVTNQNTMTVLALKDGSIPNESS